MLKKGKEKTNKNNRGSKPVKIIWVKPAILLLKYINHLVCLYNSFLIFKGGNSSLSIGGGYGNTENYK